MFSVVKSNVLVSACLLGINCRFDGQNEDNFAVKELAKDYNLVPVCPEQLGGLPTPRSASQFIYGDGNDTIKGENNLRNEDYKDVSANFRRGAKEVLKICQMLNIKSAIFKENSPSCGRSRIYLKENLTEGQGVTTSLLLKNGIKVMSENEIRR